MLQAELRSNVTAHGEAGQAGQGSQGRRGANVANGCFHGLILTTVVQYCRCRLLNGVGDRVSDKKGRGRSREDTSGYRGAKEGEWALSHDELQYWRVACTQLFMGPKSLLDHTIGAAIMKFVSVDGRRKGAALGAQVADDT